METPNVAMYGQADWSGMLRKGNYPSADAAMAAAIGGETFFFYCRGVLDLGPGKQFAPGRRGVLRRHSMVGLGAAMRRLFAERACGLQQPLQQQRRLPRRPASAICDVEEGKYPPDGGFIWLYDSVVNSLLSGCCGGTEKAPATTATAYREAITNGLG